MSDKLALILGGTSGVGAALAVNLVKQGYNVVVVGRDEGRGNETIARLKKAAPQTASEFMFADISTVAGTRQFSAEFSAGHNKLDVLVLGAGRLPGATREPTADGLSAPLATLAYMRAILVEQLAPLLARASRPR
ncbi:hypothetical protein HK100_010002, partial [Physocladia obscura]